MSGLRKLFGLGRRSIGDRDAMLAAELAHVAHLLEKRLVLRTDELAAEASALRSYVDGQLSRLTGEAPPLAAGDFLAGAFAERITFRLNQVDAALDRIDNELRAGDEDLLRIVRAQSTALRALADTVREIARTCEGQSGERR